MEHLRYLRRKHGEIVQAENRLARVRRERDERVMEALDHHNQSTVAQAAGVTEGYVRKIIRRSSDSADERRDDGADR